MSSEEADQTDGQDSGLGVYVEVGYASSPPEESGTDLFDSVNEVLRTPERDQYEDQAFMALLDIQSKCEADFQILCSTSGSTFNAFDVNDIDLSSVSSFTLNSESLRSLFSSIVVEETNMPTPVVAWYRRKLHEQGGEHSHKRDLSGQGLNFLRDIQKHLQPHSLVRHVRRLVAGAGRNDDRRDHKHENDHFDHHHDHDHATDVDAGEGHREAPHAHHEHIVRPPPFAPNDGRPVPVPVPLPPPPPPLHRMMRSASRKLHDHDHHHDHESDSDSDHEDGRGRGHGPPDRPPRDDPHPPPAGLGKWWDNLLHGEPRGQRPLPPPPPPAPEQMRPPDSEFDSPEGIDLVPSLGFGSTGDSCMLTNFHLLSAPCQGSLVQLGQVRANYLFDTYSASVHSMADDWGHSWEHDHHHHGHPILALGLLGGLGYYFYRRHQKMKDIRRILTVIEANPELRAQVESAAGCKIPPRGKCGGQCSSTAKCLASRVGKAVLFVVAFYFVLLTSFGITTAILHHMSPPPEVCQARGDPNCGPGIVAALILLGAVAAGEVALLAYVGRTFCSKCCGGGGGGDASGEDGDMGPPVMAGDNASWYPGQMYSALPSESSHGGAAEMQTFSANTGTRAVYAQTTTTTTITPREVTPVSQVTML